MCISDPVKMKVKSLNAYKVMRKIDGKYYALYGYNCFCDSAYNTKEVNVATYNHGWDGEWYDPSFHAYKTLEAARLELQWQIDNHRDTEEFCIVEVLLSGDLWEETLVRKNIDVEFNDAVSGTHMLIGEEVQ